MIIRHIAPVGLAALLLTGCAGTGSGIGGSWTSTTEPSGTDFEVAAVTFADDGTYTAKVSYADQERDDSGTWTFDNGTLELMGHSTRTYTASVDDGTLTITNPENGSAVTLSRD